MSKSKGNFYRLADIRGRGYDPLDVRFLLLATHYRKLLNFTFDALDQAVTARRRIGDFLGQLAAVPAESAGAAPVGPLIETARAGFVAGLEDDLNIAEALAAVFTLVKTVNPLLVRNEISRAGADRLAAFLAEIDGVLGLEPSRTIPASGKITETGTASATADVLEAEIQAQVDERQRARAAKDFKRADILRQDLLARGIILEDTKDGVRWKRVAPPKP